MEALTESVRLSEQILDEDLNPVIRPVLDLSNIEENSGFISGLLGAGSTYNSALAVNDIKNRGLNQNGGFNNINVDVNFTVNNAGADLSTADMERFGRQIADQVNIRLGQLLI